MFLSNLVVYLVAFGDKTQFLYFGGSVCPFNTYVGLHISFEGDRALVIMFFKLHRQFQQEGIERVTVLKKIT